MDGLLPYRLIAPYGLLRGDAVQRGLEGLCEVDELNRRVRLEGAQVLAVQQGVHRLRRRVAEGLEVHDDIEPGLANGLQEAAPQLLRPRLVERALEIQLQRRV